MPFTNNHHSYQAENQSTLSYAGYEALYFGRQLVENLSPTAESFRPKYKETDFTNTNNYSNAFSYDFQGYDDTIQEVSQFDQSDSNLNDFHQQLDLELSDTGLRSSVRSNEDLELDLESPVSLVSSTANGPPLFDFGLYSNPEQTSLSSLINYNAAATAPNEEALGEYNELLLSPYEHQFISKTKDDELMYHYYRGGASLQSVSEPVTHYQYISNESANFELETDSAFALSKYSKSKSSPAISGMSKFSQTKKEKPINKRRKSTQHLIIQPTLNSCRTISKRSPISPTKFLATRRFRSKSVVSTTGSQAGLSSPNTTPSSPINPFYKPPAILRRFSDLGFYKIEDKE